VSGAGGSDGAGSPSSPGEPYGKRLWPGRPAVDISGLTLWLNPDGEPVTTVSGDVLYAVASTTASSDAAGAPAAATPFSASDTASLAAMVPAGAGLLVDRSAGGSRTLSPRDVASLRPGPVPRGGEPDLILSAPPRHLLPILVEAREACRSHGGRRVAAAWAASTDGTAALVVMVGTGKNPNPDDVLDAVYETVVRHAPRERVRVVAETDLPTSRVPQIRLAAGKAWESGGGSYAPGSGAGLVEPSGQIKGRTSGNAGMAVVGGLVGALIIGIPRAVSMPTALAVVIAVIGAAVVVAFVGATLVDFFRRAN
jgi:hypothetical protein